MKKIVKTVLFSLPLISAQAFSAGMDADDPVVGKVMINSLEVQDAEEGSPMVWAANAWLGKDLNKVWLKTEGEVLDGTTEEAELQLLYSRAIAPFWDAQIGWRGDLKPEPTRDWLAVSLQGLAPYLFEVDASLFIGESDQIAARLDVEYEYMLTQRWVLSPEMEMNFHSKSELDRGIGSGLTDMAVGIRLRYEVIREFAPYVGLEWSSAFGETADLIEAEGESSSDTRWVAGIRAWF